MNTAQLSIAIVIGLMTGGNPAIAQGVGARYVTLPTEIDLSASADSAAYVVASVRVAGKTPRDSVTMRGQPIVYAFTVPTRAPHPAIAAKFAEYLASEDGKRVMRGAKLDVLDQFEMVGPGAPTIGTRD